MNYEGTFQDMKNIADYENNYPKDYGFMDAMDKNSYSREFEIEMGEKGIHPDYWTDYEEEENE